EIDDVQIFEAEGRERAGLRCRIIMKHRRAAHIALLEPYACAVLDVDGWVEDHHRTRLRWFTAAAMRAWPANRCGAGCVPPTRIHRTGRRITASTSGNWRSAASPAAGSFPGGTGCRPWSRGPPPPSPARRNPPRRRDRRAPPGCCGTEATNKKLYPPVPPRIP